MRVLIVDSNNEEVLLIKRILAGFKFEILQASNGAEAIDIILSSKPLIVLIDRKAPLKSGLEVCREINKKGLHVFFIIMTNEKLRLSENKVNMIMNSNAQFFIQKPLNEALLKRYFEIAIKNVAHSNNLEAELVKKELEIQSIMYKSIARIAEQVDDDTGKHIERLSYYSRKLAKDIGMSEVFIRSIELSSPLHDIGKIFIDKTILQKPGKLTYEEFEIMKTHTVLGHNLLKNIENMTMASNIALCHHENWDGTGYPYGIKKDKIPIEAQIVALVDVYDALRQKRVYKESWSDNDAVKFIVSNSGKKFNPYLVEIFMSSQNSEYDEIFKTLSELQEDKKFNH